MGEVDRDKCQEDSSKSKRRFARCCYDLWFVQFASDPKKKTDDRVEDVQIFTGIEQNGQVFQRDSAG